MEREYRVTLEIETMGTSPEDAARGVANMLASGAVPLTYEVQRVGTDDAPIMVEVRK